MINFIIQTVIQFADLFNQSQHTHKTMQYQPLNPQVSRRNLLQSKQTEKKMSYSLIKQKESHDKYLYITPIKRPIICTQSIFNPKTVKKHYSSHQFYPYQDKFFRVSGFEHVKINRARIIDWFIEICKQFNQSWNTFWMTVQLLDRLIADVDCVKVPNIHICGTILLFISSKYVEVQPLTLQKIEKDILYRKYSRTEILKCEQVLLSKLLFDLKNSSLHFPTVFDKVLELCQQTTQIFIKCVFRELAYVYMAPQMALFETNKKIRQKTLIKQVCDALIKSERFQKAGDVQQYFLEHYGCLNVRRYSKTIQI